MPRGEQNRARRAWRREAEEQEASALHPAELRLLEHDAGTCPLPGCAAAAAAAAAADDGRE